MRRKLLTCGLAVLAGLILTLPILANGPAVGDLQRLGRAGSATEPGPPMQEQFNPFNQFLTTRVVGGMTAGATCLNFNDLSAGGPTGGTITITGIPPGGVVSQAFLYYSVLSDSFPVPSGAPTIDGNPLTPVPLGTVPRSPCFPEANTGTFRINVTPYVTGNGNYFIDGFVGTGQGTGDITEGATMIVIYCDPLGEVTDVVIWEGVDTVNDVEVLFHQDITGFLADPVGPNVTATLAAAAGNGQPIFPPFDGPDPFRFNGTDLDQLFPEILSGSACVQGFYDLTLLDVSGLVNPGDTQATLEVQQNGDCYTMAAVALAVSTDQTAGSNDCEAVGCGGAVIAPPDAAVCSGQSADIQMSNTFTLCPGGPSESSAQNPDPITAQNETTPTDLSPPHTFNNVRVATLTLDLTGDTDLVNCVEIALLDPSLTRTVLKPFGFPLNSPYDVTGLYTGPGQYSLELVEEFGCGQNRLFATLTGSTLDVVEDTGQEVVEYRVVDSQGAPICDWSTDDTCLAQATVCPGEEQLTVEARCLFDNSCGAQRALTLACSNIQAGFRYDAICGETSVCFEDQTVDAYGDVLYQWNFNGQGGSDLPDDCFDFGSGNSWEVTLSVTDEAGCTSEITETVEPPAGPPPVEPSDVDQFGSAVEPLRVSRGTNWLDISWEDVGPGFTYNLYRGDIGTYYSHTEIGFCETGSTSVAVPWAAGSHYYLAAGVNCSGDVSSVGRRSSGLERDPALIPCP